MNPLTLTLIQANLTWEDKKANLAHLEQKINSIAENTEVIILPEMFSTGFSMNPGPLAETMDGPTVQWLQRVAAAKQAIVTGSIIIYDSSLPEGTGWVNRLVWMLPNGQYGYYDKRHLFAYAGEDQQYTAGKKRLIASVNGWKINLQICYDLRFPIWARQTATSQNREPEYDVLINVANWPKARMLAWTTLLQARAIENQCYVIGVNRVGQDGNGILYDGNSLVIDPLGTVLYQKTDLEDSYTFTLQKEGLQEIRGRFPFLKDADPFGIF